MNCWLLFLILETEKIIRLNKVAVTAVKSYDLEQQTSFAYLCEDKKKHHTQCIHTMFGRQLLWTSVSHITLNSVFFLLRPITTQKIERQTDTQVKQKHSIILEVEKQDF